LFNLFVQQLLKKFPHFFKKKISESIGRDFKPLGRAHDTLVVRMDDSICRALIFPTDPHHSRSLFSVYVDWITCRPEWRRVRIVISSRVSRRNSESLRWECRVHPETGNIPDDIHLCHLKRSALGRLKHMSACQTKRLEHFEAHWKIFEHSAKWI